jgi:hypothetical protein
VETPRPELLFHAQKIVLGPEMSALGGKRTLA